MLQTKRGLYDIFTFCVATIFFLILFFGNTLAYFNSLSVNSGLLYALIEIIYMLKKILLFTCFLCVFLRNKISKVSLISVLVVFGIVLYTYIISTIQFDLFKDVYLDFFCGFTLFLLFVSGLIQIEQIMPTTIYIARILLGGCLFSIYGHENWEYFISHNYMFMSNAFLIPVATLIYAIYQKNCWVDYVLVSIGTFIVMLYGSRGNFLVLFTMLIVILFFKMKKKDIFSLIITVISGLLILINTDILYINSSRTVEKLITNEFFESSSRIEIWEYLISRTFSNALIGKGFCTDRVYLLERQQTDEQVYAHNFFIEVFTDFGIVGIVVAILMVLLLLNFIINCHNKEKKFSVIMLSCTSFLALMFSRTFLTEHGFFIMLGTIINWRLTYKNNKEKIINYENGDNNNTNI